MSTFAERWRQCVASSATASTAEPVPPPGFAAAVVARWQARPPADPDDQLLERMCAGFLAAAACLLATLLVIELRSAADQEGLFPPTPAHPTARILWPL
jgi:hypothetical protein